MRFSAHLRYGGELFSVNGGELAALPSGSKPSGASSSPMMTVEQLSDAFVLSRLERRGVAAGELSLRCDLLDV